MKIKILIVIFTALFYEIYGPRLHAQTTTAFLPASPPPAASDPAPIVIRTPSMLINYQIEATASTDLASVELWVAQGYDGQWQLYGYDNDLVSPVSFVVSGEGIYRLFIVAVDRWGRRSFPLLNTPSELQSSASNNIPAQLVLSVDYTKPQLYLYSPRQDTTITPGSNVPIQWAGFDANLGPLPVSLYYQVFGTEQWLPITSQGQNASGDILWLIPADLQSPIMIKAVMIDRAFNTDEQVSGWLQIAPAIVPIPKDLSQVSYSTHTEVGSDVSPAAPAPQPPISIEVSAPAVTDQPQAYIQTTPAPAEDIRTKITQQYALAQLHSQRLEWPQAIQAYQQVLQYEPANQDVRVQLGYACYNAGQFQAAQSHFRDVLNVFPNWNNAIFGLAQSLYAMGHYSDAQYRLEQLLEQDPRDWYAWILLGDAADKQGMRQAALAAWKSAADGARDAAPSAARLANERLMQSNP